MVELTTLLIVVAGILQIILFFKIWGMTNDVSQIRKLLEREGDSLSTDTKEGIISLTPSMEGKREEVKQEIKKGDCVFRNSDGARLTVISIEDGRYLCKGTFSSRYYSEEDIRLPD